MTRIVNGLIFFCQIKKNPVVEKNPLTSNMKFQ